MKLKTLLLNFPLTRVLNQCNYCVWKWGVQSLRLQAFWHTPLKWTGKSRSSSASSWRWLPRTMSSWVLNISTGGDSTTSLANLCHPWNLAHLDKYFLVFRWNLMVFNLCPLPLGIPVGTTKNSLSPFSSFPPFHQTFVRIDEILLEPSLLYAEQCQLFQPFLMWEMLFLNHPCGVEPDSLR